MRNKFLEEIFLLEGFPSISFCCHSEQRPNFGISDVTERSLDPLLTSVINCLCSDIRFSDWPVTLVFPEMASQHCQGRSRWSQAFPHAACQQSQWWACNLLLKTKM